MKTIKFSLIAIAITVCSSSLYAQETATATATATIVTPISITKTVDINFGTVAVQSTTGGTVVLSVGGDWQSDCRSLHPSWRTRIFTSLGNHSDA